MNDDYFIVLCEKKTLDLSCIYNTINHSISYIQLNNIKSILKENTDIDINAHMVTLENDKRTKLKPFFDDANENFLRSSTNPFNFKFKVRSTKVNIKLNNSFNSVNFSTDIEDNKDTHIPCNYENSVPNTIISNLIQKNQKNQKIQKNNNMAKNKKNIKKQQQKKNMNCHNQVSSNSKKKASNTFSYSRSFSRTNNNYLSNSNNVNTNNNLNSNKPNNTNTYYHNNNIVENNTRLINGSTTENQNFRSRSRSRKPN